MHAFLEADMSDKPALQPRAAIGPAIRAIASRILLRARTALTDPATSPQDAVHDFRRTMKQWRALMRLLAPFIPDAQRWRLEARDHARSLGQARDGAAALNAFDGLIDKGLPMSPRSIATIRGRLEALRASEEQAVLTPELRDTIVRWLDAAHGRDRHVAARPVLFFRDRRPPHRGLSGGAAADAGRLVGCQRRGTARPAATRGRSSLPDGTDRAVMAAVWADVDRRGRTGARPARQMPRISRCWNGSWARTNRWPIGARGWRRPVPSARSRCRSAPPASPSACSSRSRRRSATGSRRYGKTASRR